MKVKAFICNMLHENCYVVYDETSREAANIDPGFYWDDEKNAFVDDYQTGNRNVTRHANIFALLYQLTSTERLEKIICHVIRNPEIPAITTPYFEFFELDAMCGIGEFSYMTEILHNDWGGMLKQGATILQWFENMTSVVPSWYHSVSE